MSTMSYLKGVLVALSLAMAITVMFPAAHAIMAPAAIETVKPVNPAYNGPRALAQWDAAAGRGALCAQLEQRQQAFAVARDELVKSLKLYPLQRHQLLSLNDPDAFIRALREQMYLPERAVDFAQSPEVQALHEVYTFCSA